MKDINSKIRASLARKRGYASAEVQAQPTPRAAVAPVKTQPTPRAGRRMTAAEREYLEKVPGCEHQDSDKRACGRRAAFVWDMGCDGSKGQHLAAFCDKHWQETAAIRFRAAVREIGR